MAYFRTKNPNLGQFLSVLHILEDVGVYKAIWSIFRPFGLFFGHLVYFTAIWYIFWSFWYILWLLAIFLPLWYVVPRKIWQPCSWEKQSTLLD
jgi:hypothetical protein